MDNSRHSLAIIGCGPAGLSAAIALHDSGHSVTLFERFEQPRPVGSGLMLQPTGLAVLNNYGCQSQIESLGQRIDGMLGRTATAGKLVLDIRYSALSGDLYGVAIHRAALFQVLYDAVNSRGIRVINDYEIDTVNQCDNSIRPVDMEGIVWPENFDLIVDASGRQSRLLRYAAVAPALRSLEYGAYWATVKLPQDTFNLSLLEQRYSAANIMVGVLPCGTLPGDSVPRATFFWSIKASDHERTVQEGLNNWKEGVRSVWPAVESLLEQIDSFEQLTHARYSHHTLRKPFGNRIVFIGDAAHATSPQLGQGANMALLDAHALNCTLNHENTIENSLNQYANLRRWHVRLFQLASLGLTPFYQSDSVWMPRLRDTFFEPVSRLPVAQRLVTALGAGLLTRPNERIERYYRSAPQLD